MTYLLDTNICIYALNNRHPKLTDKLLTILPDDIAVSSITVGELEYSGYSDAAKPPFRSNGNRVTGGMKPHI